MLVLAWCWCVVTWSAEGAVLDPALYLLPSPPLVPTNTSASNQWSQPRIERHVEELAVLPIQQAVLTSTSTDAASSTTTELTESMEKSETFWPGRRSNSQFFGSIHVPLTFSLSGSYGGYGGLSKGVIGSSYGSSHGSTYGSISDLLGVGKSALAGSGYGTYSGYPGTRIYGGTGGPSWSGWGNGKWGHYGKG